MSDTVVPRPAIQPVLHLVVEVKTPKRLDQHELGVIESEIADELTYDTIVHVTQPTAPINEINIETTTDALHKHQIEKFLTIIEKHQSRPIDWVVLSDITRRSMAAEFR